MLDIIVGVGGGTAVPANQSIRFTFGTGTFKFLGCLSYLEFPNESIINVTPATTRFITSISIADDGIGMRNSTTAILSSTPFIKQHFLLLGDYNFDNIRIIAENFEGRIEVRNEYGVLITDNATPWGDGTYPPDARNRTQLAGLHAAPAVINPELEAALLVDETNNERVQE